jgi:hypothetical protein
MGDWHSGFQFWLVTLICSFLGAYGGAYLKKKGENLATKEDLSMLVTQMEAVTKATKTIESEITDRSWDRQRHWEMKRDALIAALEPLTRADEMTIKFITAVAKTSAGDQNPNDRNEAETEWQQALNLFNSKRRILRLMCTTETTKAFHETSKELMIGASKVRKAQTDKFGNADVFSNILKAIDKAFVAARVELSIQEDGDKTSE